MIRCYHSSIGTWTSVPETFKESYEHFKKSEKSILGFKEKTLEEVDYRKWVAFERKLQLAENERLDPLKAQRLHEETIKAGKRHLAVDKFLIEKEKEIGKLSGDIIAILKNHRTFNNRIFEPGSEAGRKSPGRVPWKILRLFYEAYPEFQPDMTKDKKPIDLARLCKREFTSEWLILYPSLATARTRYMRELVRKGYLS